MHIGECDLTKIRAEIEQEHLKNLGLAWKQQFAHALYQHFASKVFIIFLKG